MYALATTGPTPWLVLCGVPVAILVVSGIAAVLTRVARGHPALSGRWPAPVASAVDAAALWCLETGYVVVDRVRPHAVPADGDEDGTTVGDGALAPVVTLRRDERPKIA